MAINIEVEMSSKIRRDIVNVARQSSDDVINLIFSRGSVTLLGYSNSSFCLCKEFIDCEIDYNFRVQSGVVLAMLNYSFVLFEIELKTVTLSGLDKEKKVKRKAQVKINTDTTVNYQADLYSSIIKSLRAGVACNSLDTLRQFYRISKVNPKSERGVMISNNQFYTCGPGFKYYAKTEIPFDCFVLSEDLISLVEFVGDEDNILYSQGSYIVAKNTNDCYFGIKTSISPEGVRDLETIMSQKPEMSFKLPISELKQGLKSIKGDKDGTSKISFMPGKEMIVVGTKSMVLSVPIEYKEFDGTKDNVLKLDFSLFNKLLQTLSVDVVSNIRVYNKFVSMSASDSSLLLIGRD